MPDHPAKNTRSARHDGQGYLRWHTHLVVTASVTAFVGMLVIPFLVSGDFLGRGTGPDRMEILGLYGDVLLANAAVVALAVATAVVAWVRARGHR